MDAVAQREMSQADRTVGEAFERERRRLGSFIRRRVHDPADAEDILQDVFFELIEAARLLQPIEQVGAWLFSVARNRITDLFRRRRNRTSEAIPGAAPADDTNFDEWLPSPDAGPVAAYARRLLIAEFGEALAELPEEQRSVFVAHELDGRSFKELAAQTGIALNTLLSRKRYAVLHLRRRLQAIHDEYVEL
jgi:RNA polymerase sigma factor (sigma-70 family)